VEADRDWIYRALLEWAIDQCPDAEAVGVNQIPAEELLEDAVAWSNNSEICFFASWDGGCEVLVKRAHVSYNNTRNKLAMAALNKEASRMATLRHPQVLQLYGVSENRLIMEYGRGSLDQALLLARGETRRWTQLMFLNLAHQVARAMLYCSQKIVHRALACRSIIETSFNMFKLGQFGSAIPIVATTTAKEGRVPIRSCSPEALLGVFSEKSDVWAFGVLMWEAVHYCAVLPYADHTQPALAIAGGVKLQAPKSVTDVFFDTIIAPCLETEPELRPSFRDLVETVESSMRAWSQASLDGLVPLPEEKPFAEFNALRAQ
jgi:serine/threonine protein kinase